jgi:hypothetical protein
VIPIDFLRECFEHRPDGALVWRHRPAHHFADAKHQKAVNARCAGKKLSRKNADGYCVASVKHGGRQHSFLVARIVWALHVGRWPEGQIDHINRIRDDNRIANLRDVAPKVNASNRGVPRLGTTRARNGHRGVQLKGKRFSARIVVNRKLHYLGMFPTAQEAGAAFNRAFESMRGYAIGGAA